jgi:IclR family transcriptional regulator, KDG regulon repressor
MIGKVDGRDNYHGVRVVLRAAQLLDLLRRSDGGATLTELSQTSGIAKPTVFRILRTLKQTGLVERVPASDSYRLGVRCLELGQAYLEQTDLRREAKPVLQDLRDRFNETVHLAVLDDDLRVVYLEKLEGGQAIGIMMSRVGGTAPSFCTGLGKALLAYTPGDVVGRLDSSGQLVRHTKNTLAVPDDLRRELERIRERGYALDLEEHEKGVRCAAVAVPGPEGEVLAAISLAGPGQRLSERRLRTELAPAVMDAAAAIGVRLGARHGEVRHGDTRV